MTDDEGESRNAMRGILYGLTAALVVWCLLLLAAFVL